MISVIIPLYNKEAIIERTLNSVLTQDYTDIEVIVVNDGSTDRSVEVVKRFNDQRIRLIEQENGGPSKARNTGIKNANGEWILFLDADDEITEGALTHLYKLTLKFHNANIFVGGSYYKSVNSLSMVSSYKDGYCSNIFKYIATNKLKPCTGSVLYSKDLCTKHLYNELLKRFEDYECFFRKVKEAKLYMTSKILLYINSDYNEASVGRNNIDEDFVGFLDFHNKSFWERMCLFKLFVEERDYYPDGCKKLYKRWYYRFDLLLIYKICIIFSNIL